MPLERLVIATHNRKKAGEMIQILSARFPSLKLLTLADFEGAPEPEETGSTYAENAAIKAKSAAYFTGECALADDAGLEIDALDGAPGLHSKRFGGEELPFPEKIARVLELMRDVPEEQRTARFRCCVALTDPRPRNQLPSQWGPDVAADNEHLARTSSEIIAMTVTLEETCEGRIAFQPRGSGGFGYDPIFFLPELDRTMAELTPEEKHAVSHRGKVLRMLAEYLESL